MNFAGHFDSKLAYDSPVSPGGEHFTFYSAPGFAQPRDAGSVVVVPDAHLLFSGDYMRIGNDLIISGPESKFVVGNYFKGESRPTLASKDGATLSGPIVDALTGHVQYAQAAAPVPAQVIGHVLKLTGSATVVRNGVSIELHIGDAVQKGDVVQTGADSSVGMTFIDGSAFGMTANARMVLNEMIYDPNGSSNSALISLVQGTITFVAGQTAKNGNMRVDTPVATMGIRGTAVLVEIGADDGPTRFSVLVEPDGHTGSYNLYDKVSGQLIGTVSQAGQVTFVSSLGVGQGVSAVEQLKTMQDQQAEKAIIQQVFQLYFPNYNPDDSKPNTNKFGFSGGNNLAEIIITTTSFGSQTTISQIELHFAPPDSGGGNPAPPPAVVFYNAKAAFSAKDVFLTEAEGSFLETRQSFKIGDFVKIDDPDIGNPPFYDIGVPFVPGSAIIKSATAGTIPGLSEAQLKALLDIDQATGQISFKDKVFDFIPEGQTVEYVIQVTASSGPDSAKLLIHVTITGTNDAPTLAGVTAGTLTDTAGADSFDNLCGQLAGADADAGETASLTYAVLDSHDGPVNTAVAGLYGTLTVDSHGHYAYVPNADAINALGAGTYQDTFTIVTTDIHGATGTATFTVNVEGADDAPVFDTQNQYVTESIEARGFSLTHTFTLHDLIGRDVDAASTETFMLTATAEHGTLALARNHDDLTVTGRNTAALEVTGTLDAINDALQGASDGLKYTAGLLDSRVEHVALVITDDHGLSDTLNFVFQQNSLASGSLTGGAGKDVIFSNLGNNVMTGGAGADTFVFDGLKGIDVITDFHQGEDLILISNAFGSFDDLLAHTFDFHGNAVIVSGLSSLTVAGIDKAHLTASDFHIVA